MDAGRSDLRIRACDAPVRALLLGGVPFEEEIVMWWNFIGRSHEEVSRAREQYERGDARFGAVDGYVGAVERIPAPPLPTVGLRPRRRERRGSGRG